MELIIGKNYTGKVIEICGIEENCPISFFLNENYQAELICKELSRSTINKIKNTQDKYVHAEIDGNCVSFLDINFFSTNNADTFAAMSSFAITGDDFLLLNCSFSEIQFQITDGYELIGLCPYDITSDTYNSMVQYRDIEIPTKCKTAVVQSSIGCFTFTSYPS